MTRWRAPDLTDAERATLDALDAALEAGAMWGTWTCKDRREWERMLEREGRPKGEGVKRGAQGGKADVR